MLKEKIEKVADIHVGIYALLIKDSYECQKYIFNELRHTDRFKDVSRSVVYRGISSLKEQGMLTINNEFCDKEVKLKKSKRKEITELLTLYQKWDSLIQDNTKEILRIHGYRLLTNCKVDDYPEYKFRNHNPNHRKVISRDCNVGTVSIDLKPIGEETTCRIGIDSFFLVMDVKSKVEDVTMEIDNEVTRRHDYIKNHLECYEIYLSGDYEVIPSGVAFVDDKVTRLAIKEGIWIKDRIDKSVSWGEYEVHDDTKPEIVWKIIEEREGTIYKTLNSNNVIRR